MNKIKDELEYIEVSNSKSSIKITLQGAHIFDFRVKGKKPLLFLSDTAHFKRDKAIRGGIPICWPWFGAHPQDPQLPNHGFVRTSLWKHLDTQEINQDKTKITFSLESSEQTLALWPYAFELRLEIIISDILEISLITKNTGEKAFNYSQALHTYLAINDISTVKLEGLKEKSYYNKLDDSHANIQKEELIFKEETDRIYQDLEQGLTLHDKDQDIKIQTKGSKTVVVWNPGEGCANNLSDLHTYKTMLCIESANVLKDEVFLQADESHTLSCIIKQVSH